MDFDAVVRGISTDVTRTIQVSGLLGWVMILLTLALPLSSFLVLLRGSRLALIPLLGSIALLGAWVFYYLTGWWRLEAGAIIPFFGSVFFGWAILAVALWRLRKASPHWLAGRHEHGR